jgi:hypothetical protein
MSLREEHSEQSEECSTKQSLLETDGLLRRTNLLRSIHALCNDDKKIFGIV